MLAASSSEELGVDVKIFVVGALDDPLSDLHIMRTCSKWYLVRWPN